MERVARGHSRIRVLFVIFLFLSVIQLSGWSQGLLQQELDRIATGSLHSLASIGVAVYDTENGACIGQLKKDVSLIPASNMKLVTTLAGLHLLGEEYRYETRITYDGSISEDSTLHGNIYIEGSGDPTLGSSREKGWMSLEQLMERIAGDIRRAGIRCVAGQIVADPSVFSSHPVVSSWANADLGNYYAAGAWGINVNENICYFYFDREGKRGRRSTFAYCEPSVPAMQVENQLRLSGPRTGERANIYGGPYNFTRSITGTIPRGKGLFTLKGSLPDPPGLMAHKVWEALEQRDMGAYGSKSIKSGKDSRGERQVIARYRSPSMADIVRHTNEMSINMYAESILKTVGWIHNGDGAETSGIQAIVHFLLKNGVDTSGFEMHDGSGLSRKNRMSADFLARFLSFMTHQKNEEYFTCYLPAVGENGTVRWLLHQSPARGSVWAKSGSMRNIVSYSGYCRAASGRLVSFSLILNNKKCRKSALFRPELEKIMDAIYRFS